MDVLRLHGAGDLRTHDEPEPVVGPGEALVRVTAVGLCGSDLHWYEDGGIGETPVDTPLVLGHEMGGVIVSGPGEGLRVAIEPGDPCGTCEVCQAGHGNLCPSVRFCGHGAVDGGLRALMAWPRKRLLPVPVDVSDDEVALFEPLSIGLHAIELSRMRPGMSVGVFGCGPVGLLLIRALRAVGASRIVATDALTHRVEAALASGADEAHLTAADGQPDGLDTWEPLDLTFEVAGVDAALETALRAVRIGGRVVIVGIPGSDRHSFPAALAREHGLTIVLSRRARPRDMQRAIEMVDDGVVDLSGLITARYPLEQASAAFDALLSRSGLKVVVNPT